LKGGDSGLSKGSTQTEEKHGMISHDSLVI